MHYRNGREARNGDKLMQLGWDGKIIGVGVLYDAVPGNDYCNGKVAPIQTPGVCLIDCLHLDDVEQMLREKGFDHRPTGK